jgi:hypothetical protein
MKMLSIPCTGYFGRMIFHDNTLFKSVFNSIEIEPFSPEGKKAWKGMKTV